MSDPATDNPAPAPSVAARDETAAQIDAVLGEIQTTAEHVTQTATQALAAADEAALKQIADAVPPESAIEPPTTAPAAESGNESENLDAQLERLTAGLLEEEAKVATAPAAVSGPLPAAAPVARASQAPLETHAPAPPAVASAAPTEVPSASAAAAKSPPEPAPQAKPRREPLKPIVNSLKRTMPVLNGLALKALAPLSRPLISSGKAVRIGVSLLAVQSLVLAVGSWGFLAFAKPTASVAAPEHGFDFKKDGLPQPPTSEDHDEAEQANAPAAEGHAQAKEGEHGAAKPTRKKTPAKASKKPPAKKPASEEHGGGGH